MIGLQYMKNDGEAQPDPRRLLTRSEVAERLRVCRHTVRLYELRGYLSPIRITARTLRYRAAEVEDLLASLSGRSNWRGPRK